MCDFYIHLTSKHALTSPFLFPDCLRYFMPVPCPNSTLLKFPEARLLNPLFKIAILPFIFCCCFLMGETRSHNYSPKWPATYFYSGWLQNSSQFPLHPQSWGYRACHHAQLPGFTLKKNLFLCMSALHFEPGTHKSPKRLCMRFPGNGVKGG